MWLFDKFKELKTKKLEREVKSHLKVIKNPKSIREDRVAAIDYFKAFEDPETAVPALLSRFDFSLEHGINDSREKESVMAGIIACKEKSVPFVKDYLRKSTRIAWPIKILGQLISESEMIQTLEGCMDFNEVSFDREKTDKNYDILCYLREYKLPDHGHKFLHFLKDHDERVRFAVVEVLLEQNDEEVYLLLEPFAADDSAENTRMRQAVVEHFLNRKRPLHLKELFPVGPFMPGVGVDKSFRFFKI